MRTLMLGLVFLAACGSVSASFDFDPDADFTSLKSYKWLPTPKNPMADPADDSPLVLKRVRRAVDAEMAAKGYKRVESGADFHVVAHLSSRQRTRVTSTGSGTRYGYSYWGAQNVDVYDYEEGSLILDVVDHGGKKLMWRGVARSAIPTDPKPEQITKIVDEACAKLIAKFPPQS